MIARAAALALLIAAAGASPAAREKLALEVTPNVSNAPSTVVIRAVVPKDAGNRSLYIEADSGQFFRSSTIQLDGAQAPIVTEVRFKSLPSGHYTVAAQLRDDGGAVTVVRRTVIVLSGHEP